MIEAEAIEIVKPKKKLKSQKSKKSRSKVKKLQPHTKRKIQLTQEFEENEREVATLLENASILSESINNEVGRDDTKSPSEKFFCGINKEELKKEAAAKNVTKEEEEEEDGSSEQMDDPEEILSKNSTDDLSNTTRSQQPTLASTFIQIAEDNLETLIRLEKTEFRIENEQFSFKPSLELEQSLISYPIGEKLNSNLNLFINRLSMEAKVRKGKVKAEILEALKSSVDANRFFMDPLYYRTSCDFKFKPIFVEPSWDSMDIPSKKLLTLHLKDIRFTEHPDLQEEHKLANDLELLYEHRCQRLKEKITEKLYADLQVQRNILNELLKSEENSTKSHHRRRATDQERKAYKIEQHSFKVKALREKLYDEEHTNKQLLQDILHNWLRLKNLRKQQSHQLTRLKLRLKIEDLKTTEIKNRQQLWSQRFDTDLNEIYREKLEEYYRAKRLWRAQRDEDILPRPRKPDIGQLSSELKDKYAKCLLNPKEPRIDIVRIFEDDQSWADMPGPRKLQSYYMRVFFDGQMVGETRTYRLERDLSYAVNEKLGIVLNRRLPKDIKIKLYQKQKLTGSQKIANIIVPLPLPSADGGDDAPHMTITFSSHKQSISGYLRLNLQSDEQIYPQEIVERLFPAPGQHTHIPRTMLKDWYEHNLMALPESTDKLEEARSGSSDSEEEDNREKLKTCTFQEDLLRFCDVAEIDNNPRIRLLRSRYTKNDSRTRDLRFIPMLEHELEFEWESEERVLDPGNWMDPIDLHKHEGKKYLKQLYEAIHNQCVRLTKVVASQENLLLNDEPMSWSAFFQTLRLIFQPRLILNPAGNMLTSSSPGGQHSLSMDHVQKFKIVCNIIRATGIPVRITNPEDTDSRGHGGSPVSSNVFVLQNLKYSNVRPFVTVNYKDKFSRTMTAEGSNPTWNEQLVIQISGSLSELRDDLKICLFDEVVENQWNDDSSLKNTDIFQRIQNNWLGEYRIPISAILSQQKIDGVFELNNPKIVIGYKRPSLDNITSSAETNIMIEQFPEIKESIRLWCYISVEPALELPSINTKCLECSELMEIRQCLSNWSMEAWEMKPDKFLEPMVCSAEGKRICITRLLQAIPPPIDASENLLDSACRFVSLLSTPKSFDPCMSFSGVWMNNELLLDTTWGSSKDLGVLLCSYLLHLGLQCWLVLGLAYPYGQCAFVLFISDEEMQFIDPCSGKRYSVKDVFCPLYQVKMVIGGNNFYLNIQSEHRVSMMNFNFSDSSCWLAGFNKRTPAPQGGFHAEGYKYRLSSSIGELKYNIERKIMKKISSWRTMRKTVWNRAFQPRLLSILQAMEQSATFGSGSSYEELKYNNMLAAEFPNYKIFGFTLNYSYTNLNQISERIKSTGIHLNSNKNVEFSLAVHIHSYPNNVLSIWIFLISIVINK
ncbi:coiled-coil and C2 domain-containing protein 2A [Musca domestica]|uniref:Coiled-coil and C2 domain-containing protein 2A n=1 Tax=Musca domestica TaxID=7370 RepID=A0ABM3V4M6_MUSDO|nr:coiled-coil and C2 domain-containing protein 2A [Musca domestica]